MSEAVKMSFVNMRENTGGPFVCVVVRDGEIIARGSNTVIGNNDPTAHAEVVAIRAACSALKTFQLKGCTIYTSCEPCPMCVSAIDWARPDRVYYANTKEDAAAINFNVAFFLRGACCPYVSASDSLRAHGGSGGHRRVSVGLKE